MSARILFVAPRFHTNLWFATRALVAAGHRVEVFVPKEEPTEDHSVIVPRIFAPGTPAASIRRAVHELAPDLIFLRKARPVSQAVAAAARFGRYPVWHYDQRAADRPWPWWKALEWRLQGLPARRVTPKKGLSGDPHDPLATYLPWPVAALGPVVRPPWQGPLRVLCVGKLMQPRKNQDKLIAAMQGLLDTGAAELTLVGSRLASASGAEAAHLAMLEAAAAGSGGRIRLLADQPFAAMPALYAAHDVCVLPARGEPLGSSPIEAMAYGCVPVLTTQCGTACYIADGIDGFVVRAGDVAALRLALEKLAGDPALLAAMGAAARATAEGELGPERFVARVEALLAKTRR